ncbi:hypothetical protein V8C37DRAFT_221868 [Trichoderma ceciliae]
MARSGRLWGCHNGSFLRASLLCNIKLMSAIARVVNGTSMLRGMVSLPSQSPKNGEYGTTDLSRAYGIADSFFFSFLFFSFFFFWRERRRCNARQNCELASNSTSTYTPYSTTQCELSKVHVIILRTSTKGWLPCIPTGTRTDKLISCSFRASAPFGH